jgi:hypothetical protein
MARGRRRRAFRSGERHSRRSGACRRDAAPDGRRERLERLRHGAVRVDRDGRSGVAAGRRQAPARWQRLRRGSPAQHAANHGVHVGVVEMGITRTGGHRAAAGVHRERARPARRRPPRSRADRHRRARCFGGPGNHRAAHPHPHLPVAQRGRAAHGRARGADDRAGGTAALAAGLVRGRERIRVDRDPDCVANGRRVATAAADYVRMGR